MHAINVPELSHVHYTDCLDRFNTVTSPWPSCGGRREGVYSRRSVCAAAGRLDPAHELTLGFRGGLQTNIIVVQLVETLSGVIMS